MLHDRPCRYFLVPGLVGVGSPLQIQIPQQQGSCDPCLLDHKVPDGFGLRRQITNHAHFHATYRVEVVNEESNVIVIMSITPGMQLVNA